MVGDPEISRSNGNGLATLLTEKTGQQPATAIEHASKIISHVETICAHPDSQMWERERLNYLRAHVRFCLAHLQLFVAAHEAGFVQMSSKELDLADQLRERLDELDDTLSWGAEDSEEIRALAEAACA